MVQVAFLPAGRQFCCTAFGCDNALAAGGVTVRWDEPPTRLAMGRAEQARAWRAGRHGRAGRC